MKPNRSTLAATLPILLMLNGCQGTEAIEVYDAPKDANLTAGPVVPDTRTLAAAIYRENATWFLKLMGPIDAVTPLEVPFQSVLRGIRFAGPDAPANWTLPANWKEEKGTGFRVATLKPPESALEIAVTRFDGKAGSVLANVNRWREELGLEALRESELATALTSEDVGGITVQKVDLTGKRKAKSSMRPGMPGGAPFAAGGAPPPARKPAEQSAAGLNFTPPAGWKESAQKVTFAARVLEVEGSPGVKVTFTPLSPQGGNSLENVNRWRMQLGLAPWKQNDLDRDGTVVPTQAGPALLVDLEGGGQKLLGAILTRPDAVWFVKLSGPPAMATPLREPFISLLRSVRFD
jgi:hypothetical protein